MTGKCPACDDNGSGKPNLIGMAGPASDSGAARAARHLHAWRNHGLGNHHGGPDTLRTCRLLADCGKAKAASPCCLRAM
jgi:hypothetical protein